MWIAHSVLSNSKAPTPNYYSTLPENVAILGSNPFPVYQTLDKQLTVLENQPGHSFSCSTLSLISTWKTYILVSKCTF